MITSFKMSYLITLDNAAVGFYFCWSPQNLWNLLGEGKESMQEGGLQAQV